MTGGSSTRKPLMAGNWKMHNTHFEGLALVQKLAFTLTPADYEATEVVVLPPFTALRSVQTLVSGDKLQIGYGAQDLSPHDKGAYTGDVSGPMLAKLGCSYVLAGHSERRQYHGEDDALVNAKAKAAFRAEMTPILCVGEHLEVRRAGEQLVHCSTGVSPASHQSRWRGWWWPTSRSGPSAPGRWRHLRTRKRSAGRFAAVFPGVTAPKQPQVCVSCMAGR
jgi:triosephosphate isomerase